jgi:hypothetical protein
MSLYRQAGGTSRRVAIAATVVALLIGGAAGFAIGRGSVDEPSLSEQVDGVRESLQPARTALELVTIEYPEAVNGGEIVAETEYAAAQSQAQTAASTLEAAEEDLRAISPDSYEAAVEAVDEVSARIEAVDDPAAVEAAVRAAHDAVDAAAGAPA